ncbi:hypothetical protein L1987_78861 [Smallanthus sonchifolius]|uniref:Uncharacterized protein n=1 Tax=Smallanthus sonchifolius TaxID=185202 RepID=A0ACB8ZEW8_9ASTR|nr:hypothetical protein L1987_78861 [Smallanthus sonchifolius]
MMKAKLVEIEGYLFCSILSITTVRTPQPQPRTHLETLDLSFVRFPIEETLDLEVAVFLFLFFDLELADFLTIATKHQIFSNDLGFVL